MGFSTGTTAAGKGGSVATTDFDSMLAPSGVAAVMGVVEANANDGTSTTAWPAVVFASFSSAPFSYIHHR